MGQDKTKSRTYSGAHRNFLTKPRKVKEQKRQREARVRPLRQVHPRPRTYLLAAAAAGIGLGVRRRAAAAPGRGVKVPGIILVHDPRWGPERKQGVFLPQRSPRPRTGCCALLACAAREAATLREQCLRGAERGTSSLPSARRGPRGPPGPSL